MKQRKRFNDMGRTHRLAVLVMSVALVTVMGAPAIAQYPPAPLNPECHSLIGGSGTQGGRTVLPYLGTFRVQGGPGCTEGGSEIEVDGQSHRINLHPGFAANADGSFLSPVIRLSPHMTPGPHQIIPVFTVGNVEFFCPILIVDASTTGGGGGGGAVTNARDTTNGGGGGGGGGGVLPRTGTGIIMLILWALALVGLGTALVFAARRGGLRAQPLRVVGARFRKRGDQPPALPAPDVPYIDTTGFVPVRPQRASVEPSVTEADVASAETWDD